MTAIDDKYRKLKRSGFDLGKPRAAEKPGHSGGRMRAYQRGNIYWHRNTGAHEVHGAILTAYRKLGGPGPNPATGTRELGYPKTDEHRTRDNKHPKSEFEWGSICYVHGRGACRISHDLYKTWQLLGGETGPLGHLVSSEMEISAGQAAFFQYGCIYRGAATGGVPVHCLLDLPRIGQPHIAVPDSRKLRFHDAITCLVPQRLSGATSRVQRALSSLWKDRLALRPTKNARATLIPLTLSAGDWSSRSGVWHLGSKTNLADRTLYDIVLALPGETPAVLAPHALYAKRSWDICGLMHATDLHISRRLEAFRDKLVGASRNAYVNYNDGVRSIVSYANRLYRQGKLDAIFATGDLVDYIFEHDDSELGGGNWDFLEKLLCGQAPGSHQAKGEELLVPLFACAGNHDYRKHPYELLFDINIRAWPDPTVKNYESHNLTADDAKRLQGGKKTKVGSKRALDMIAIDKKNLPYFRRIVREPSYVANLGNHRLVMIDSRWDAGMLTGTWDAIRNKAGFGSTDERNFSDGHPNSEGIQKRDLDLVKQALNEATRGVVIVGVHAPPLNTAGNEYAHYFRETERPHADMKDIVAFLMRQGDWVGMRWSQNHPVFPSGWLHKKKPYFKNGSIKGLDYGVSKGKTVDFLELCTGKGALRPVDVVFSGHVHRNVEYRLERTGQQKFQFYTDFYTESPRLFYPSHTANGRVYINVKAGAQLGATPRRVRDMRGGGFAPYEQLDVPPYHDPLDSNSRPKDWWRRHRPLLIQTASAGPMDTYQRLDSKHHRPPPSFRGTRMIFIVKNVISQISYVTIEEMDRASRIPKPVTR